MASSGDTVASEWMDSRLTDSTEQCSNLCNIAPAKVMTADLSPDRTKRGFLTTLSLKSNNKNSLNNKRRLCLVNF